MAARPDILLAGQVPDIGATFRNALLNVQGVRGLQQAQAQAEREAQLQPLRQRLLQAQTTTAEQGVATPQQLGSQRNLARLESVANFSQFALPGLQAGDIEGTRNALQQRRQSLIAATPPGQQADTTETDEALQLLDANPQLLAQRMGQAIQAQQAASGKSAASFTLGPGQQRFGPTGDVIAEIPAATKLSPLQQKVAAEGLDPNTPEGQKRARELNQRAATDPSLKLTDRQILSKASEGQLASAGFANRVQASNAILTELEDTPGFDPTSIQASFLRSVPGGNIILSEEQQRFQQAKEDFITAVLRKESGAAIGVEEFEKEDRKFFPQIGDKPGVLKQKAIGRERAFQNLSKQSKGVFRVQFNNPQILEDGGQSLGVAEGFNEGDTATNPQTGQKIIVRNGQWVSQ
jgi:hypothetical protein